MFFLNMASILWVADSPLWRMFSRFVFALVGPESSPSNTVASTADHSDQPGKNPLKYSAVQWERSKGQRGQTEKEYLPFNRTTHGKSSQCKFLLSEAFPNTHASSVSKWHKCKWWNTSGALS